MRPRALGALLVFTGNTIFWCLPLNLLFLLSLVTDRRRFRSTFVRMAERWIDQNSRALERLQKIDWQVSVAADLKNNRSYLVCSNHQSWVDIVVLQHIFNRKIPFLRFFIKHRLSYVPLLGVAWIALDFPRMRRHSRADLARHPERRGLDLAETRRACTRLRGQPVSILNFLEGSRFSEAKRSCQNSPHRHLLRARAGGVGSALGAMGNQFEALLDVTIYYPNIVPSFWDLLSGRVTTIRVDVREVPIPSEFAGADYLNDLQMRGDIQRWVDGLWREKAVRLDQWHEENASFPRRRGKSSQV